MSSAYKSVQAPPTRRGIVQTGMGKPGGPAYQAPPPLPVLIPAPSVTGVAGGGSEPLRPLRRPFGALAYLAPKGRVSGASTPLMGGGTVQTDMTGRQPYAGREPMMGRGGQAPPGVTADSDTHPGRGGLSTGHTGPFGRSGNMPIRYRPSDSSSAAEQGVAARDFVRGVARANGGMPADLESPGRAGRPVGINPPGASRRPGMESHG